MENEYITHTRSAEIGSLAINTVVRFGLHCKKSYQIDFKSNDFVYLHEFAQNGQIFFVPADCEVIVHQGF